MRRAVLLYNPVSGRAGHRIQNIERVAEALRKQRVDVSILRTEGVGTAGRQAASADADILFACGGDGTINEVIQGLAYHPRIALGIIPMGSANAVARHLKVSLAPVEAALQQLNRKPASVPLGRVIFETPANVPSRYFLAMAGAGPDGALVYKMAASRKQRLGRLAYYLRAADLFHRTRFPAFPVTLTSSAGQTTVRQASAAMVVRVADLGGLFGPLIRGGELHHPHLRLTVVAPPAVLSLPAWFAASWAGLARWNSRVETVEVTSLTCGAAQGLPVHVQLDGEWVGHTPITVDLVPDALRLLVPDAVRLT